MIFIDDIFEAVDLNFKFMCTEIVNFILLSIYECGYS